MSGPRENYPWDPDWLLFLPLGGTGEIGMNLNLYGYRGRWLMADLGITFADPRYPGVDIITPDPGFIAQRASDLVGLVLTHAHEDHLGAVPYLWPRLQCPIYATPFTAALLRSKLAEAGLLDEVPLTEVPLGGKLSLPPFDVEFISLTHSIPEPNALVLRTDAGTVVHTGDWKIDPEPLVGGNLDDAALRRVGDEGVLATVCDSTNVLNAHASGSEASVRENLVALLAGRRGRVAVTTFASNVARIETVAAAAQAHGRHLCLVGRSLWRVIEAARATGYLETLPALVPEEEAGYLPPEKVLYLCTGCQGEPRGAMARIAAGDHRNVVLETGDLAVFSSKIIPGNELAIGRLFNLLAAQGVEVVTEHEQDIHVSGHPGRPELAQMYQWLRPQIAVPVHGEPRHLMAHAALARELQVPQTPVIENGQILRLAPGPAEVIGEVQTGRLMLDGTRLIAEADEAIRTRRGLMHNGGAVVTLVADTDGRLLSPPSLVLQGVPADGGLPLLEAEAREAVSDAVAALPAAARRDDGRLAEAARVAARRLLRRHCGKRPLVQSRVIRLEH